MSRQNLAVADWCREFDGTEGRLFRRYGLAPQRRFVDLVDPGVRVRVLAMGTGDPVLFVHGIATTADDWVPLMARLPGFRLLAIDLPGARSLGAV
jgi:pimeloyl-ACP methyl ester carboxylesterase